MKTPLRALAVLAVSALIAAPILADEIPGKKSAPPEVPATAEEFQQAISNLLHEGILPENSRVVASNIALRKADAAKADPNVLSVEQKAAIKIELDEIDKFSKEFVQAELQARQAPIDQEKYATLKLELDDILRRARIGGDDGAALEAAYLFQLGLVPSVRQAMEDRLNHMETAIAGNPQFDSLKQSILSARAQLAKGNSNGASQGISKLYGEVNRTGHLPADVYADVGFVKNALPRHPRNSGEFLNYTSKLRIGLTLGPRLAEPDDQPQYRVPVPIGDAENKEIDKASNSGLGSAAAGSGLLALGVLGVLALRSPIGFVLLAGGIGLLTWAAVRNANRRKEAVKKAQENPNEVDSHGGDVGDGG